MSKDYPKPVEDGELADVQSIYRGIKDFINAKRGKK
jgi:hypothetical protein